MAAAYSALGSLGIGLLLPTSFGLSVPRIDRQGFSDTKMMLAQLVQAFGPLYSVNF